MVIWDALNVSYPLDLLLALRDNLQGDLLHNIPVDVTTPCTLTCSYGLVYIIKKSEVVLHWKS